MFILFAIWINSIYHAQNIVDSWNALIQGFKYYLQCSFANLFAFDWNIFVLKLEHEEQHIEFLNYCMNMAAYSANDETAKLKNVPFTEGT